MLRKLALLSLLTYTIPLHPRSAHDYFQQACTHMRNGNFNDALALFTTILEFTEKAPIHFNCGLILTYQKKYPQALEHFDRAIALDPQYAKAYLHRGKAHARLNNLSNAKHDFQRALSFQPRSQDAYIQLAKIHEKQHNIDQAINCLYHAYNINPKHTDTLNMLCFYLINNNRLEEGVRICKQLNTVMPNNINVLQNIAYALSKLNRRAEALPYYEQAVALDPHHDSAQLGYAKALLACGKLSEAWPSFEYRAADLDKRRSVFGHHKLRPEDFTNKTVLLRCEWGLGDMMQFIRYAKLIKERNATVIVRIFKPLQKLFSLCSFIDYVVTKDDPIPECDIQVPMLSLPMIFDTTLETIPADIPYLKADQKLVGLWKKRLEDMDSTPSFDTHLHATQDFAHHERNVEAPTALPVHQNSSETEASPKNQSNWRKTTSQPARGERSEVQRNEVESIKTLKIGICWHAKPIEHIEKFTTMRRSIPLKLFAPLAQLDHVQLYSLQKVYGEEELDNISFDVHTFGPDFDESHGAFMDTAAIIQNLDLVITADTSIVHLAGALGKQVWVLLPYTAEWRWMHERTDSPWYPSNMRLFRQTKPGNWTTVIQKVHHSLQTYTKDRS